MFSRILNLRFFFHEIFIETDNKTDYYLKKHYFAALKKKIKFCEKKFVDSGFVKTCDELAINV